MPRYKLDNVSFSTYLQSLFQSDTTDMVKQAAILDFPLLLYNLGPNANHLVYDLIQ